MFGRDIGAKQRLADTAPRRAGADNAAAAASIFGIASAGNEIGSGDVADGEDAAEYRRISSLVSSSGVRRSIRHY